MVVEITGTFDDWLISQRTAAIELLERRRPLSIPRVGVGNWYLAQNKGYWKYKYGLE